MTAADKLTIEYHDGAREEFEDVRYTLARDRVVVQGADGAELVVSTFDVADVRAEVYR